MAIALQYIDFIVPIQKIRAKYPGGWEQCLEDHAEMVGGRVWYDQHLFRDGAMNPIDIAMLLEDWKARGFKGIGRRKGEAVWIDCCVVESLLGGPTLPCEWLSFDKRRRIAFLKGTNPGRVVGPLDYVDTEG